MWEIFLLLLLLIAAFNWWKENRDLPPGPWLNLPVVGYIPFLGRAPVLAFMRLGKKYGDIFTIKLASWRLVVLNDAEVIKEAFKEDTLCGRPDFFLVRFRSLGGKNGLIFNEGQSWMEQRRFTLRNLRDFGFGKSSLQSIIQDEINELSNEFRLHLGSPVTLQNKFNLAVLNALWSITTGQRFHLDDPTLKSILKRLTSVIQTTNIGSSLFVMPFMRHIFPGLTQWNVLKSSLQQAEDMMKEIVDSHKATFTDGKNQDFTDVYLQEMKDTKDEESSFYGQTGEKHLRVTLLDMFIAGAETTSTTLTWCFLYMIAFPHVQKKVQDELDEIVGRDRAPSIDDKTRLPFTEAVIMESQRMASITPIGVFHSSMVDTYIRGYRIPKDSIVVSNLYNAMNNPDYWGDPENFRPERFLDDKGRLRKEEAFMPFSTGKRVCIGESLAKIELYLFFTTFLHQYNFTKVPGTKLNLDPVFGFFYTPHEFSVIMEERL